MNSEDPYQHFVQQAKAGHEDAMGTLFDVFFEKVFHYVAKRVDKSADAEDITSDVFLDVVQQINDFEEKSSFATWVYSIARNKIAKFWRERYALPTLPLEEALLAEEKDLLPKQDAFVAAEEKWEQLHELVKKTLHHLPEQPRKLLELRFLQNCSLSESAKVLGLRKNAAKVAQFRALKKLRELAEQEIITLSS